MIDCPFTIYGYCQRWLVSLQHEVWKTVNWLSVLYSLKSASSWSQETLKTAVSYACVTVQNAWTRVAHVADILPTLV